MRGARAPAYARVPFDWGRWRWRGSERARGGVNDTNFMPVRIRLKRVGARNTPIFRVVVADGRSPRDGKFIEEIGTYQPGLKDHNFNLKLDRAEYWIGKGAQPSDTVASFVRKARRAAAATAQ